MDKGTVRKHIKYRYIIQLFFAAVTNSYVTGFAAGKIHQGNLKLLCHPGLNCYSCPGAVLSCPIGALQAVIGSRAFSLSAYVFGTILVFGALMGRAVCGFLCPFGLIQEGLYKIPFPKKINRFRGDRPLRRLKYVMLLLLVVILPMTINNAAGNATPYFCKLVCPAGTLEGGVPLVLLSRSGGTALSAGGFEGLSGLSESIVRPGVINVPTTGYQIGLLFWWKFSILAAVILLSIINYRPFCKYLCPLGALYGMLNPVALYRLRLDGDACIHCGKCSKACKMVLDPVRETNHSECVRCGDCVKVCPTGALDMGFGDGKLTKLNETRHHNAATARAGGKERQ